MNKIKFNGRDFTDAAPLPCGVTAYFHIYNTDAEPNRIELEGDVIDLLRDHTWDSILNLIDDFIEEHYGRSFQ
jgi:hypothetical protein